MDGQTHITVCSFWTTLGSANDVDEVGGDSAWEELLHHLFRKDEYGL